MKYNKKFLKKILNAIKEMENTEKKMWKQIERQKEIKNNLELILSFDDIAIKYTFSLN